MLSSTDLSDIAARAGVPVEIAEYHGPLLALIAAMQKAGPAGARPAGAAPALPPGFDVHASYTADEAATFLGLARKSIYEIPEGELPRSRVGGTRTAIRFVGLDLLCYRHRLPLVDWRGVRDAAEEQLRRAPVAARGVRSMPGVTGPRRVV